MVGGQSIRQALETGGLDSPNSLDSLEQSLLQDGQGPMEAVAVC